MSSSSATVLYSKAQALMKKGRYFEAELILTKLVERFPENQRVKARLNDLNRVTSSSSARLNPDTRRQAIRFFQSGQLKELASFILSHINDYPNDKEFLELAGAAFFKLEKFDCAELIYRRLIGIEKETASFHTNLSKVLLKSNNTHGALSAAKNAVYIDSDSIQAHENLGSVYLALNQIDEAISCFKHAVTLAPVSATTHVKLGSALRRNGQLDEAQMSFKAAVELEPKNREALNNLGLVLQEEGSAEAAVDVLNEVVVAHPRYWPGFYNLGLALKDLGKIDSAIDAFKKVMNLNPAIHKAAWNLALLYNLKGDFAEGFRYYEARFHLGRTDIPNPDAALLWDGVQVISEKNILIFAEQGLGDIIQFARYMLTLLAQGGRIYFLVDTKMHEILCSISSEIILIDRRPKNITFHFEIALASLPYLLRTEKHSIPTYPRYLHSPKEKYEEWKQKLKDEKFKIGICWQGSIGKIDKGRSFALSQFRSLSQIPDVQLISLQKGEGTKQLNEIDFEVVNFGSEFDNGESRFVDTAAVIENCDLIITSDTSVAHLAGALGARTWVMLQFTPDWRWSISGSDCLWYPSLELFRQEEPGDWESLFDRIKEALLDLRNSA